MGLSVDVAGASDIIVSEESSLLEKKRGNIVTNGIIVQNIRSIDQIVQKYHCGNSSFVAILKFECVGAIEWELLSEEKLVIEVLRLIG